MQGKGSFLRFWCVWKFPFLDNCFVGNSEPRYKYCYLLGCRFLSSPPAHERDLYKMSFAMSGLYGSIIKLKLDTFFFYGYFIKIKVCQAGSSQSIIMFLPRNILYHI